MTTNKSFILSNNNDNAPHSNQPPPLGCTLQQNESGTKSYSATPNDNISYSTSVINCAEEVTFYPAFIL